MSINLKPVILVFITALIISACGQDDASSQSTASVATTAPAGTAQPAVVPAETASPTVVGDTPSATVTESVEMPPEPEAEPAPVTEAMPAQPATPTVPEPAPVTETPVTTEPAPTATAPEAPAPQATGAAQTYTINAEARVFNPDIVYIQPGDTVQWINMTSHTSTSIDGLIPAGATPWQSKLGENLQVTLTVEGVYGYYCQPHIGFGMMGVIVVGKPGNLEEVKATADKTLQGPFRSIIGKLNKVAIQ